jgi:membrane fusion protein, copper/silver efflux system
MPSNSIPPRAELPVREPTDVADAPLTKWQKIRLVIKVVELRLRFVALMAITGLVFAYWDTIWNRYDKWMRPAAGLHAAAYGLEFYCPMHPHIVQDEPGSCPICGMTLAKRPKGEKPALATGLTSRVALSPKRVEQAGIRTAEVAYAPLTQAVTTVGNVAFDERRMATIVSKVPGKSRVEKLFINVTGENVEAGQPLAELYSPELSQAIQELLNASRRAALSIEPQTEIARSLLNDRREMVRASAEKLKRWGITQAQIDEVLAKGKADFAFPILSPKSGHVFKKNVVEGQEVPEGYPMFEVIDLDMVWVQAQVYEHQLGLIHEGQTVRATVEAFPGESFVGQLEFMQPHLDATTRTVEVRYALKNPGHRLRPGMFATVTLETPVASLTEFRDGVAAPESPAAAVPIQRASMTAAEQKNCPVTAAKLGSMGDPIPVQVEGRRVWTCCAACPPKLKAQPARFLARLEPAPTGQVLSVPESAVIYTGARKVVYVESAPGVYEGREVVLGPRAGDRFAVLEGLALGEKVAAAGAFLIDAESRLNPAATPARSDDVPTHAIRDPLRSNPGSTPARHQH